MQGVIYITFRSVTAAMGAAQLLKEAGISNAAVRTPQQLRRKGCGYSLRLQERGLPSALQVLKRNEAVYGGVFRQTAQGQWQEVTP